MFFQWLAHNLETPPFFASLAVFELDMPTTPFSESCGACFRVLKLSLRS